MIMEEYCVMCGTVIPEGTHICVHCGELHETGNRWSGKKLLPGGIVCQGRRYQVSLEEDKFYIRNAKGENKLACTLWEVQRLYHTNKKVFGRYGMIISPKGSRNRYLISYEERERDMFQKLNEILDANCKTISMSFWHALMYQARV